MAHWFDTFKLVDRLKAAGFASEQPEAIVGIISEAQDDLVTRKDLQIKLAPVRTDSAVLKRMMGVLLAGVMSLILKAFTVHSHQPSLSMPPKAFKPFRYLHTSQRITPSIPWDRLARFHWEGPLARGQCPSQGSAPALRMFADGRGAVPPKGRTRTFRHL